MLKTRFIDKILEALGDEAGKIKIFDNTSGLWTMVIEIVGAKND